MSYLALAGVVLLLVLLVTAVAVLVRRPARTWWARTGLTLLALLVLTLVFNSLMISVGLVGYNPGTLHGLHLGPIPIEDFAWPLAAGLLLPALSLLLRPPEKEASR